MEGGRLAVEHAAALVAEPGGGENTALVLCFSCAGCPSVMFVCTVTLVPPQPPLSPHAGAKTMVCGTQMYNKLEHCVLQEVAGKPKENVFDVVEGCDTSELLRLAKLSV